MSPEEIEELLALAATASNVSVAKLRAVYIRGVKDAVVNGLEGPPNTFGLVRVHRFTAAISENNHRITQDFDLLPPRPKSTPSTPNHSIEYDETDFKNFDLIAQILSGDISRSIPGVEDISFDSETKELTITTREWSAKVNLKSEEYSKN